mgnify:FL=1
MTDNAEAPEVLLDENGWTMRPPISDRECILICLRNAPAGTNKKQVAKIIQELENEV